MLALKMLVKYVLVPSGVHTYHLNPGQKPDMIFTVKLPQNFLAVYNFEEDLVLWSGFRHNQFGKRY